MFSHSPLCKTSISIFFLLLLSSLPPVLILQQKYETFFTQALGFTGYYITGLSLEASDVSEVSWETSDLCHHDWMDEGVTPPRGSLTNTLQLWCYNNSDSPFR